jgi:hypothetical protein
MKMEVQRNDNRNPILSLTSCLLTQNFVCVSYLIYACYMSSPYCVSCTLHHNNIHYSGWYKYNVNINSPFPLLLGLSSIRSTFSPKDRVFKHHDSVTFFIKSNVLRPILCLLNKSHTNFHSDAFRHPLMPPSKS